MARAGGLRTVGHVPDCFDLPAADLCPDDDDKTDPGACGCGVSDVDANDDGVPDCFDLPAADLCPDDDDKVEGGACGCGVSDVDANGDGVPDCLDAGIDLCPDDDKTLPGICGCGVSDVDDNDNGIPDCLDVDVDFCPDDDDKVLPGACGCGVSDVAAANGIPECFVPKTIGANFGGTAGADAACNASANKPDNRTYKALLTSSTRRACTSQFCETGGIDEHLDWVLEPHRLYLRPTGVRIGRTNAAGILRSFDAPIGDGGIEVWTGLTLSWNTASTCLDWTSNSSARDGSVGIANEPLRVIDAYSQFCNRTNVALSCVEQ